MPHAWFLGNDVVDLESPRCRGKAKDHRFLARVFSPHERREIESSPDPDTALWMRWAGKEAAFKSISRLLGTPPVFHHQSFQVDLGESSPEEPDLFPAGMVRYRDLLLPLKLHPAEGVIHALTWAAHPEGVPPSVHLGLALLGRPMDDWRESLRPRFSPREWECISHSASAVARLAARHAVATALGTDESLIEVRCGQGSPRQRPPIVFVGGREATVELSLSHHGRLVGWAFTLAR